MAANAAWRRRALVLGSGCMCDLMWRCMWLCMWEAPFVMTGHLMIRVNSGSAWVPQEGIAEHSHRAKNYALSDGDMIRNRNGFEEDIDGVLAKRRRMIQKLWERIIKELYSFRVTTRCECMTSISITVSCVKTNPSKSSLVYSNSGSIFGLTFYDASTNVHGRQTLSLCRTVNPEDKRRIIGDMFVKVIDRTANDLNVIWDNLLLGQVSLRPDLIGAASHMASSRADAIKTHHNDSEMVRQLRIYGRVVEPLKDFISIKMK
ncbi:hypothetical protein OUZ56_027039 [Daphnia magna]|uniref:GMPS ATP-PPase domain-containing protein n=2 Tax=Daphnia magna TaxID=35525 RepID=A0ABQ9ZPA9_9CRUS|nr:hypothetical protein OUZ56_027039 [Daphnia magna]